MLTRDALEEALSAAGDQYAESTATTLTAQGYALVAVSGLALHAAAERGELEQLPPAAPEQAARIEQWCSPVRVS